MSKRHTILATWVIVSGVWFFGCPGVCEAAPPAEPIPHDSWFNPQSAFLKEQKRFPEIRLVKPALPESVAGKSSIVYSVLKDTPYGDRSLHLDVFHPTAKKAKENPALWKRASPLEYVGAESPPVLFVNSSIPRFHAGRDDFVKVLDRHGIDSEVHTFDNSPHPFWLFHPWFEPAVQQVSGFLDHVFKQAK